MILPLSYKSVAIAMLVLIGVFFIFYPYLQAETLSAIHSQTFDIPKICKTADNLDFRNAKIVNYEKQRSNAQLYCLYKDRSKNSLITLYFDGSEGWQVEYTRNYKKDIGLFWPIYY
jgi:hypothetical protein